MEPLPEWNNWSTPEPQVLLYGDGFTNEFKHHAHTGMVNRGNTCYLISSVQALLHVPIFTNWLIDDDHHFQKCRGRGHMCVTCALSLTFKKVLGGSHLTSPTELCNYLEVLGLHWGSQEDANDFLVSLFDTMRKEYLNRYPEMIGVLDYCSEHTTVIDMLFGFWIRTEVTCKLCNFTSCTYSVMMEVQIKLLQTIAEGLQDFFLSEEITMKCSSCKRASVCSCVVSTFTTPEILVVQLRRKINMEKDPPNIGIDLSVKFGGSIYELCSIIEHKGPTRHNGHYTSYAKCPDLSWSFFDDSEVLQKKSTDLTSEEVQKNVYILLYQKKSNQDNKIQQKKLPKMSSPIGLQPFLISPMKNGPVNKKKLCAKLSVVEERDEKELADPLIWSSDEAESPLPINSRRLHSNEKSLPLKMKIKRTVRTSPKASSSQSSHYYDIIGMDTKVDSTPVKRSPVKLKISRMKRLSPKADSAVSEHTYKVVHSPLKKITITRRKRLSPKANSTQSAHSYKIKCPLQVPDLECQTTKSPLEMFDTSFDLFNDLDNPDMCAGSKEKENSGALPLTGQETPIWNVELYENEVEGAVLAHDKLSEYKNKVLQRWLQCRGLPYGAKRPELLKLVQACIDQGKSHILDVRVDNGIPYRIKLQKLYPKHNSAEYSIPERGWGQFVSVGIPQLFNYGHIYNYVVESAPELPAQDTGLSQEEIFDALESEDDNLDTDQNAKDPFEDSECPCLLDEKPLRRGMKFLKSGHVHSLNDVMVSNTYHVKASVAPSMPGPDKKVGVAISVISGSVQNAYCSCKANALGRCSHVSALLLYILRHVKLNGYDGMYKYMVGVWSVKLVAVREKHFPMCFNVLSLKQDV